MPIHEHNEIEVKLPANRVDVDAFRAFCFGHKPVKYTIVSETPDTYWEQGANVVRHRDNLDGTHELTVKRRKSDASIRDRLEVDLHFAQGTRPPDVEAWLMQAGFRRAFTLTKTAHIFWFRQKRHHVTVVIYDVWRVGEDGERLDERRFIEVEAEKGSEVSVEAAKRHLRAWVSMIDCEFDVGEPSNESLWEIYSGKRYGLVEEPQGAM